MRNIDKVRTIGQIKERLKYGDYTTLGSMLKCSPEAAKKRFLRGNEEAKNALLKVVENREQLVHDHQIANSH